MLISVFTPSNNPKYLNEAYQSLIEQTASNWEWVILLNNGAKYINSDERVRIYYDDSLNNKVGYLKREACKLCNGDVLLELDHDDMLLPTAIEEVTKAFEDKEVVFAYSNTINHDVISDTPITWSERYGWTFRPAKYKHWTNCVEAISAAPLPQNISRIWFAPNHLRAWRKTAYWEIGGHNPSMPITDDHDLMMRTYLYGKMVHIDKPLYFYRVHGDNTWLKNADDIQTTMWQCHDKYIGAMAEKWAKENNLKLIDLCCGFNKEDGYIGLDINYGDIKCDLNEDWALEDNSVGVIRASDAVEHLRDPIHTMNEAWRVLAHGGFFFISVPSTKGEGAFSDPTHVSFWNLRSFQYYINPDMNRYIQPRSKSKFQAIKLTEAEILGIPYVFAHLIAIKKETPRFYGDNFWDDKYWRNNKQ